MFGGLEIKGASSSKDDEQEASVPAPTSEASLAFSLLTALAEAPSAARDFSWPQSTKSSTV
jgi:hypothetical protein